MLPLVLRIILIIISILLLAFVVRSTVKSKMRIEDTLFWLLIVVLILILSLFPQIVEWVANLTGFMSPSNLVLSFFVFILIVKVFSLSKQVSKLEDKVKELAQRIAVNKFEDKNKK